VSEVAAVNASPLIFLAKAGRLDLLRSIGASRILVPAAVLLEVTAPGHLDAVARAVSAATWLEAVSVESIPPMVGAWDLGSGESAVVAAALARPGARAIIDDLSGRRCALAVGVEVIGTLGVVIAAHRRGQVIDPKELLLELREHGMWLSDSVVERALQLASEGRRSK